MKSGVFNDSKFVILNTNFLKSLDDTNLRSGYAEMSQTWTYQ